MARFKRVLILLGILVVLTIFIGNLIFGGFGQDKSSPFGGVPSQTAEVEADGDAGIDKGEGAAGGAGASGQDVTEGDAAIAALFEAEAHNAMVKGSGHVLRLISDDDNGSRHQRFIIELASGRTLLIAHNIDLALRVEPLAVGDRVIFLGEYEYNEEGGTIHWTHNDPDMVHIAGYVEANGTRFQ